MNTLETEFCFAFSQWSGEKIENISEMKGWKYKPEELMQFFQYIRGLREDEIMWCSEDKEQLKEELEGCKKLINSLTEVRNNRDETIEKLIGWLEKSNISPLDYQK